MMVLTTGRYLSFLPIYLSFKRKIIIFIVTKIHWICKWCVPTEFGRDKVSQQKHFTKLDVKKR